MKRWIISKIEVVPDQDLGGYYRMAIQRYNDLNFKFGEIPVDPDTGIPILGWGFALVASADMARFAKDNDIDVLPDFPLDAKVGAMHSVTKTKMRNSLTKHGIPTSIADNADGFRDVVRGIGKIVNPNFVEDAFDVNEV